MIGYLRLLMAIVGLSVVAIPVACSSATEPADTGSKTVYIVAGQSNAHGVSSIRIPYRGATDNLPPDQGIEFYYMDCTNPRDEPYYQVLYSLDPQSYGYTLFRRLRDEVEGKLVIVQFARCGAALVDKTVNGWYPGDDPRNGKIFQDGLYTTFSGFLQNARALSDVIESKPWSIAGMFWLQGEGDSMRHVEDRANVFTRNLDNLFWLFRRDLGEDLPIVVASLREITPNDKVINDVYRQRAASDPRMVLVESADSEFMASKDGSKNVHFSTEGLQTIAGRLVDAMHRLRGQASK